MPAKRHYPYCNELQLNEGFGGKLVRAPYAQWAAAHVIAVALVAAEASQPLLEAPVAATETKRPAAMQFE